MKNDFELLERATNRIASAIENKDIGNNHFQVWRETNMALFDIAKAIEYLADTIEKNKK